jgi:hypothetical protein
MTGTFIKIYMHGTNVILLDKQKRHVYNCIIHVSNQCAFPHKRQYDPSWLNMSKAVMS